jgi:hypothetical protein
VAKPVSSKTTTSKRLGAEGREDMVSSATEGTDVEKVQSLLDAHPGKPQPIPVSSSDVGGELLALLSKGLYTNPLDSIREYVQNSVDAEAQNVTIKISGSSLQIFDDGEGMGFDEILAARQFGLSSKSIKQHVGFRGIGIYSGFDLCQRLVVTSLRAGDDHSHILTFDFGSMRKQLDTDRQKNAGDPKTSLTDLLSRYTAIAREPSLFPRDQHFTSVELQTINDTHLRQLSNRKELRQYLLQNLPIDFTDAFPEAKKIRAYLKKHVPGYNAITITLQAEGQKDELVAKYAQEDLRPPKEGIVRFQPVEFDILKNTAGVPIAVTWSAMNTERSRVQARQGKKSTYFDDRPDYEGFVYKVKGFTIGDRRNLQTTFKRKGQLYPWYTGEVYVLDTDVVPNAERDDFETNAARRSLDIVITKKMSSLEDIAEKFQAQSLATKRLEDYTEQVAALAAELDKDERSDDMETYSTLDRILKDLQRQKGNLEGDDKPVAEKLVKKIQGLQKRIQKRAERQNAESERRASKAKKGDKRSGDAKAGGDESDDEEDSKAKTGERASLLSVIDDAGWDADSEIGRFAAIIQESLDAILGSRPEYGLIVADISARLAASDDLSEE